MYPFFEILGRSFSSYGLFMAIGIIIAAAMSIRRIHRLGGQAEDVLIVGACAIALALLCGALLYAFATFSPQDILSHLLAGDFSIFGGIVFYGGLIGGLIGAVLGIRLAGCEWHSLENAVVPTIPLGHAFGRIGCLMAGCCHGTEYDGPLAVHYSASVLDLPPEQGYFPVQLLEALINVGLCLWLFRFARKDRPSGQLLTAYLSAYSTLRFLLEYLRGDPERGSFLWLSVSQWISVLILTTCFVWLFLQHCQNKNQAHPV